MRARHVWMQAVLINVILAGSALAAARKPDKAEDGTWQVLKGTVTSVSLTERNVFLEEGGGKVSTHLVSATTKIEKPYVSREIQLSEVLPGDVVTLYINPANNVVSRIIYPFPDSAAAPSNAVQSSTMTAQGTPNPVIGTVVTITATDLSVLQDDGNVSVFKITGPMAVQGTDRDISGLQPNQRVKIWSDSNGNVNRASTLPADVNQPL